MLRSAFRRFLFLVEHARRGNLRGQELTREHRPGDRKALTASEDFLARARLALENEEIEWARTLLRFGEIMSRESMVEYLVAVGRLWLEFGVLPDARALLLQARDQAGEDHPLRDLIQRSLLDLECRLAPTSSEKGEFSGLGAGEGE